MKPEDFIVWLSPHFEYVKGRGYLVPVFAGQSAWESGWGKSPLTVVNNLWGHKFKQESDVGVYDYTFKETPEERNGVITPETHPFRVYPTLAIGVQKYCDKYEETWDDGSLKYPDKDFSSSEAFLESIHGHYCTDSRYVEHIMSLINEYDLEQYA